MHLSGRLTLQSNHGKRISSYVQLFSQLTEHYKNCLNANVSFLFVDSVYKFLGHFFCTFCVASSSNTRTAVALKGIKSLTLVNVGAFELVCVSLLLTLPCANLWKCLQRVKMKGN